MPNGTRRGHYYTTRTGQRAWRGAAKIKAPVGPMLAIGGLVALGLFTGGAPLLAHPGLLLGVGALGVGGFVAWRAWRSGTKRRAAVRRDRDRHDAYKAVKTNRARVLAKERKREVKGQARRDRLRTRQSGDRRTVSRVAKGAGLAAAVVPHPAAKAGLAVVASVAEARAQRANQLGGVIDGDVIRTPSGMTWPLDPAAGPDPLRLAQLRSDNAREMNAKLTDDGMMVLRTDQPGTDYRKGDRLCATHGTGWFSTCTCCHQIRTRAREAQHGSAAGRFR